MDYSILGLVLVEKDAGGHGVVVVGLNRLSN
jgi:hypothetical protein